MANKADIQRDIQTATMHQPYGCMQIRWMCACMEVLANLTSPYPRLPIRSSSISERNERNPSRDNSEIEVARFIHQNFSAPLALHLFLRRRVHHQAQPSKSSRHLSTLQTRTLSRERASMAVRRISRHFPSSSVSSECISSSTMEDPSSSSSIRA